jgi:hypothetical protein
MELKHNGPAPGVLGKLAKGSCVLCDSRRGIHSAGTFEPEGGVYIYTHDGLGSHGQCKANVVLHPSLAFFRVFSRHRRGCKHTAGHIRNSSSNNHIDPVRPRLLRSRVRLKAFLR